MYVITPDNKYYLLFLEGYNFLRVSVKYIEQLDHFLQLAACCT